MEDIINVTDMTFRSLKRRWKNLKEENSLEKCILMDKGACKPDKIFESVRVIGAKMK